MSKTSENGNRNLSPLKFLDEPLSLQEQKTLGEQASMLLDSPVFNLAWRSTIQDIQEEWLRTEPKEREKRESLHAETRFATKLLDALMQRFEMAKRIKEDEMSVERKLQFEYDENTGFPGHEGAQL